MTTVWRPNLPTRVTAVVKLLALNCLGGTVRHIRLYLRLLSRIAYVLVGYKQVLFLLVVLCFNVMWYLLPSSSALHPKMFDL